MDVLSTEEISRAVRDMGELGVRTFIITGGEPLLRGDIFDVMALAKDQGIKNICLATNGYLVERYARELKQAGLSRVYLSVDGIAEKNDEFRGMKGSFQKVLEALDFFKKIGVQERIVNTMVNQHNIRELDGLKKILVNSSATLWNIQIAVPSGRAKNVSYMFLNTHQYQHLFHFIRKSRKDLFTQIAEPAGFLGSWDTQLRSKPFFCGAGLETCSIMPDGEILGCHLAYDNSYSEGNIKDGSFISIWKHTFERFRHSHFDEDCETCKYFHACRGGCWGMRIGNRHCLKENW